MDPTRADSIEHLQGHTDRKLHTFLRQSESNRMRHEVNKI